MASLDAVGSGALKQGAASVKGAARAARVASISHRAHGKMQGQRSVSKAASATQRSRC